MSVRLSSRIDPTWLREIVTGHEPEVRDALSIAYHLAAADYYDDMPAKLRSENDPQGMLTDEFHAWVQERVDLDEIERVLRRRGFIERKVPGQLSVWDPA